MSPTLSTVCRLTINCDYIAYNCMFVCFQIAHIVQLDVEVLCNIECRKFLLRKQVVLINTNTFNINPWISGHPRSPLLIVHRK